MRHGQSITRMNDYASKFRKKEDTYQSKEDESYMAVMKRLKRGG